MKNINKVWVMCGYGFICTLLHNSLGWIQVVPQCNSFVPVISLLPNTIKRNVLKCNISQETLCGGNIDGKPSKSVQVQTVFKVQCGQVRKQY